MPFLESITAEDLGRVAGSRPDQRSHRSATRLLEQRSSSLAESAQEARPFEPRWRPEELRDAIQRILKEHSLRGTLVEALNGLDASLLLDAYIAEAIEKPRCRVTAF